MESDSCSEVTSTGVCVGCKLETFKPFMSRIVDTAFLLYKWNNRCFSTKWRSSWNTFIIITSWRTHTKGRKECYTKHDHTQHRPEEWKCSGRGKGKAGVQSVRVVSDLILRRTWEKKRMLENHGGVKTYGFTNWSPKHSLTNLCVGIASLPCVPHTTPISPIWSS